MDTMSKPEAVERFHIAFLQVLPQHLPPANYVVKGGANLRLWLGSVRRSEDIDFNFIGRTVWNLKSRMDAAIGSPALVALLATNGMKIMEINPSKTTDTTGRWKFKIAAPGQVFASKVEFSMRGEDRPAYKMEAVSARLAAKAGMRAAVSNHYLPEAAVEQKIEALAGRTETQARDVFDLDFLFTRYSDKTEMAVSDRTKLDLARRRVFEITYKEYRELVVTYLDPDFVAMYDSEDEWERIALNVSTRLDTMWGKAR